METILSVLQGLFSLVIIFILGHHLIKKTDFHNKTMSILFLIYIFKDIIFNIITLIEHT